MNAISKHIFNQSRELAKLPTVEHIRESVFGGKTSVDDLIARVDNTIAICCDPVPRTCYQAARFLARAKEHLCDRVMTVGEVQAWYAKLGAKEYRLWYDAVGNLRPDAPKKSATPADAGATEAPIAAPETKRVAPVQIKPKKGIA